MNIINTVKPTEEMSQEDINSVSEGIKSVISQLSNGLDLSCLDRVFIPEDFGTELIAFQKQYGLREGYTNHEHAVAVAKVLEYIEDGKLNISVFLNKNLAAGLFYDEGRQKVAHMIHHELGHVHDGKQIAEMLGPDFLLKVSGKGISELAVIHALTIWNEYAAVRLSISTIPKNHDLFLPHLIELIASIKNRSDGYIQSYRFHGDIEKLFGEIQYDSQLLLRIAATVHGYFDALSIKNHEAIQLVQEQIPAGTYFEEVWKELGISLKGLYMIYPNWKSPEDLRMLATSVIHTWNALGIFPSMMENGGIYIDVP